MNLALRYSKEGFNSLEEKNINNYILYGDEDNVFIKKYKSGFDSLASGSGVNNITHNLQYIPFYMVYFDEFADGNYKIMNNQYNLFSVPTDVCASTIDTLTLKNFQGRTVNYGYDIFYDDMSQTGNPTFKEDKPILKIVRPGKNNNSKNPNDYIMHSDLNNFKILKSGHKNLTLNGGSNVISHGANVQAPFKYFLFIKFPDGKTALVGGSAITKSYDGNYTISSTWMDGTNIYIASPDTPAVSISYIIYGTGKDNSILTGGPIFACTKSGKNALISTNPDDFNFHSKYETLKYFKSDTYSMTVSDNTTQTITHNLGYVPFFMGFGNDLQAGFFTAGSYAILPYYLARSNLANPLKDIATFIYADDINIYLKSYYQTNAIGTSKTFTFYYKIFKNNLNINL